MGEIRGIDISEHQVPSKFNLHDMVGTVSFVICRATYGDKPDTRFLEHVTWARDQGYGIGAYGFYRQTKDDKRQADVFTEMLLKAGFQEGDQAPWLDLEWNDKYDGPVNKTRYNEGSKLILAQLEEEWGATGVYIAPGFFEQLGHPAHLLDVPWWISHYTKEEKPYCPWKEWSIWQFTGAMRVPWYDRNHQDLDMNIVNLEGPDIPLITRVPLATE